MKTLTIYDKHPHADAYRIGGSFTPHAIVAQDKRFTDAELAAEYWMAYARGFAFIKNGKPNRQGQHERAQAIHRFASLPHFDGVPA